MYIKTKNLFSFNYEPCNSPKSKINVNLIVFAKGLLPLIERLAFTKYEKSSAKTLYLTPEPKVKNFLPPFVSCSLK